MNDDISRRVFVEKLAFSTLGVSVLGSNCSYAQGHNSNFGKAKNAIIITLGGGMSHIDSFDPKENYKVSGDTKIISTKVPGLYVSDYFRNLSKHAEHFSLIRSMTGKSGAHESATYQLKTSYQKSALINHPSIGPIRSFIKGKNHPTLPDTVLITTPSEHPAHGYLNTSFTPLPVVNPNEGLRFSKMLTTKDDLFDRIELLKSLNGVFNKKFGNPATAAYSTLYDETLKTLQSKDLEVFDLNKESKETRERYGMETFGQGLLLARRLVENGVSVVEVGLGGWDHHVELADNFLTRSTILDRGLDALFSDLVASGKINETLIVVETEFGRTPIYRDGAELSPYNANNGRDHYVSAFSAMVGGCGIGGRVIGKTDEFAEKVTERPVTVNELNSTIAHLLGIKHDLVWTSPPDSSAPNRPFTVGNGVKPILELIS